MVSIRMTSAVVKDQPCFTKKNTLGMLRHTSYQPPDCNCNRVAGKKCGDDESMQSAGTLSCLYFEGITTVPASPQEKM